MRQRRDRVGEQRQRTAAAAEAVGPLRRSDVDVERDAAARARRERRRELERRPRCRTRPDGRRRAGDVRRSAPGAPRGSRSRRCPTAGPRSASSGAGPGFVSVIVSRPVQRRPWSDPRSVDIVCRRGRIGLAGGGGRGGADERQQRQRQHRRAGHSTTKITSLRGPCTPSTRSSSMSEVALGPETSVIGRPSAAAGASAATASGTDAWMRAASTKQMWQVGHERERAAAAVGAAVEHDRAGLGDRERAAGQHAVEAVELARGDRRIVDESSTPASSCGTAGGTASRAAPCSRHAASTAASSSPPAATRRTVGAVLGGALAEARDDLLVPGGQAAPARVVVARDLGNADAGPSAVLIRARTSSRALTRRAPAAAGGPPCERPAASAGSRLRASASPRPPTTRGSSPGHVRQLAHRGPPAQRTGHLRERAVAQPRQPLRALVAAARPRTRARARPSRAAPGSSGSSPRARPGRAGARARSGCRS